MTHNALRRSFMAFHVTLCAVIFIQSIMPLLRSITQHKLEHSNLVVMALASAEAVAALLFLLPATMRWAGAALLAIFGIALTLHAVQGEFPSTLLVYATGVIFVMAHGTAFNQAKKKSTGWTGYAG